MYMMKTNKLQKISRYVKSADEIIVHMLMVLYMTRLSTTDDMYGNRNYRTTDINYKLKTENAYCGLVLLFIKK